MDDSFVLNESENRAARWLSKLTMADGAFFIIAMGTAVSRFTNLGQVPLSPDEAQQAWASWQFWQPGGVTSASGSPAYFSLTSLLFPLLGDSDAIARLIPALFGLALVLLPWLLRERLGAIGALTASLLLAISPVQTITARTVGGDAIALFGLALILVGWLRFEDAGGAVGRPAAAKSGWFTLILTGLAIGLASSPLFYSGLITLALAGLIQWRALWTNIDPDLRQKGLITAAVLFLALSSLFLWRLSGLGAAAALPAAWLSQFRFSGADLFDAVIAFVRYEPFLLLGGVTAVFWANATNHTLAKRLGSWSAGIILLMLLQRGQMGNVALLALPAALLIGLMADDLLQPSPSRLGWAWAGGLFLLLSVITINLARYSRVITLTTQEFASAWVILMALTTLIVTVYFVGTLDSTAVSQGSFLGLLAFAILIQWGTGWQLAHIAANDPRERWVTTATDDDIRYLSAALTEISWQATNSDHELTIFSGVESPALRWYLRDFNQLQMGASLPAGARHDVVISPNRDDLALGSDYAGADYGLLREGLLPQETPSQTPFISLLRWLLFHDSTRTIHEERVILWWRVDLSNE